MSSTSSSINIVNGLYPAFNIEAYINNSINSNRDSDSSNNRDSNNNSSNNNNDSQRPIYRPLISHFLSSSNTWHFIRAYHSNNIYNDYSMYLESSNYLFLSIFLCNILHPINSTKRLYKYMGNFPIIIYIIFSILNISNCSIYNNQNNILLPNCNFNYDINQIYYYGFITACYALVYTIFVDMLSTLFWLDWRSMLSDRTFGIHISSLMAPELSTRSYYNYIVRSSYWTFIISIPGWILFISIVNIMYTRYFIGNAPERIFTVAVVFLEIFHFIIASCEFFFKRYMEITYSNP